MPIGYCIDHPVMTNRGLCGRKGYTETTTTKYNADGSPYPSTVSSGAMLESQIEGGEWHAPSGRMRMSASNGFRLCPNCRRITNPTLWDRVVDRWRCLTGHRSRLEAYTDPPYPQRPDYPGAPAAPKPPKDKHAGGYPRPKQAPHKQWEPPRKDATDES